MPELPEVETMRRGILAIVGAEIVDVGYPANRLKPIAVTPPRAQFRKRLVDRVISGIQRRGKRIVIDLTGHLHVVIEPRMTGLLLLAEPPDTDHLRVRWELRGAIEQLWFWDRRGLGTISLMKSCQLAERLGPERLGPDALELEAGQLMERLQTSRRAIKVALLDQRAIAGIGNLYASEILHVARIRPGKPCCELTRQQWQRLDDAIRLVLTEAVRYEGSTLSDGTYRTVLNRRGGYQNHHRVYMREGQPCPRCRGRAIRRIVQAQRSTFWCPGCQSR